MRALFRTGSFRVGRGIQSLHANRAGKRVMSSCSLCNSKRRVLFESSSKEEGGRPDFRLFTAFLSSSLCSCGGN
jgi:hypothetical protein